MQPRAPSRPRDPRLPAEGTIIAGKYQIVRVVGEGGMGLVFEGVHVKMRQRVAIKVLLPETLGLPDVVARFEREARASGQLRSRHAARVMDVDQTPEGIPYMVMEFLDGQDLGTQIDTRGKIPVVEAVDYVLQACVAITEAHEAGIVHRDLKPSNLFLARDHEGVIVKLLDFGISKVTTEADRLTSAESVMGTPLYMSPEQVRSARNVDERADIWSLGVILYELVSGLTPFSGTTTQVAAAVVTDEVPPILVEHGAPPALQDIVLRALQKDRNNRQRSARELAASLLPFADPSSTGARAVQAMLAGGALSSGQFGHAPSGPISHAPTRPSGPAQIVQAATGPEGQDATVFNPPLDLPLAPNGRPKTERTWTRGGEKKKASPFLLFGIVALAAAIVIGLSLVGLAKLRGTPKTPIATATSIDTSAATTATTTAISTTTSTPTSTATATATEATTATPAASAPAASASVASAPVTTTTQRPRGGGKPPTTSNAGATTATAPAKPQPTATPPASAASPGIPNHI